MACKYCDGPGGEKTYRNQVCLPINGKVQCIDHCIHHIVAALNAGGIGTIASCCGHGTMHGNIILDDDRVLIIIPKDEYPKNMEEWGRLVKKKKTSLCDKPESNASTRQQSGKSTLP